MFIKLIRIKVTTYICIELIFDPRDIWIGLYWTYKLYDYRDWYICIIPMLPIHIIKFYDVQS